MPRHPHHTRARSVRQAPPPATELWTSEVVPQLPPALATQARALKALQRKRAFASAADLLRGLLGYVLVATSFASVAAWAVLIDLADVSVNAWRKRLRAANPWLLWLLGELLAAPAPAGGPAAPRGRVLIIDATYLPLPGPHGICWRVHTAYDLGAGRLAQVTVTDQHGAEGLSHYALQPGDLVVADRGYGYRQQLALVQTVGAQIIVRVYAPTCPIEADDGAKVDVLAWLRAGERGPRSLQGWCRVRRQRVAVRLLAVPLAEDATRRAHRHARQKGKKRKRPVRPETLVYASWMVLVTTLPAATWSDAAVLQLYRARWHIELVFKRMKQVLKLGTLRTSEPVLVEATIRLWLIAWALQEAEGLHIRQRIAAAQRTCAGTARDEVPPDQPPSSWTLTQLSLDLVRHQVRGQWSQARLHSCVARLRRFLCPSPRQRKHRETDIRRWLEQHWSNQRQKPHQEGV